MNYENKSKWNNWPMLATVVIVILCMATAVLLVNLQANQDGAAENVAATEPTTTTLPDGYTVPYETDTSLLAGATSGELFADVSLLSFDTFSEVCSAHDMTVTVGDPNGEDVTIEGGINVLAEANRGELIGAADMDIQANYVEYPLSNAAYAALLAYTDYMGSNRMNTTMLKVVQNDLSACIGIEYTFLIGEETPETATGYGQTWTYWNDGTVFAVSATGPACAEIPDILSNMGIIV